MNVIDIYIKLVSINYLIYVIFIDWLYYFDLYYVFFYLLMLFLYVRIKSWNIYVNIISKIKFFMFRYKGVYIVNDVLILCILCNKSNNKINMK